jgi:hypothetical protein
MAQAKPDAASGMTVWERPVPGETHGLAVRAEALSPVGRIGVWLPWSRPSPAHARPDWIRRACRPASIYAAPDLRLRPDGEGRARPGASGRPQAGAWLMSRRFCVAAPRSLLDAYDDSKPAWVSDITCTASFLASVSTGQLQALCALSAVPFGFVRIRNCSSARANVPPTPFTAPN